MDALGHKRAWIKLPVGGGILILWLAATGFSADARTRQPRQRETFQVPLQPFSLVRDAVHAAAAPAFQKAPRAVARVAAVPVRVANHHDDVASPRAIRGEGVDEEDGEDRIEQSARAQPIRVAYVTARPALPVGPTPEDEGEFEPEVDRIVAPRKETFAEEEDAELEMPSESRSSQPMVGGSRAILRNGIAYAPSHAPQSVKNAIWAANSLRRKPYVWGGGHGSFYDRGYDCSGAVSFALHAAGALRSPLPSSDLRRYGERGRGRWITIYSRRGHTFAVIAGLRLDTTDFDNGGNSGPRWHADMRETRGYTARHPAGM